MQQFELARQIYDLFVIACPLVLDVTLADTNRARDLLMDRMGISARDALHEAVMLNHGIEWIATFDAGFAFIGSGSSSVSVRPTSPCPRHKIL